MRRSPSLVAALLSVLLLVGVTACSHSDDGATVTQETVDTVPATDQVDTTEETLPSDEVDDTTPGSLAPGGTKVPKTFPKRTTTTRPKQTPTTTAPKPKTTTTTVPRTTTTRTPPTTDPNNAAFCGYAAGLDLASLAQGDFPVAFANLYHAIVEGLIVAPKVLVPYLNDVKTILDQLKPLVDRGEVSTSDQAAAWFLTQPPEVQDKLKKSFDTIKLWYAGTCK